ncbi:unnamed protein product [Laminaria digitata]
MWTSSIDECGGSESTLAPLLDEHTAMGSTADQSAYHCLVEGIEFYPLLLREAGIVGQLCRIMPAIKMTVGEQAHRTRSQSNRWRENAVWQNEMFVFEVGSRSMDLTATCINVSGEGLTTIGAANVKLAPNGRGTSVQQMSLLRKSRSGHLVLAGTLHLQITFFKVGGGPRRGPSLTAEKRIPKTTTLGSLSVVTELTKSRATFRLPSPGSDRRASFPVTRVDYASLQLNDIKADPLSKDTPGNWFHARAKNGISRVASMTRLTMAIGLAIALLVVLVLRWLSTAAPSMVVVPANDTLVSGSRWKRSKEYHEAVHKHIVDVLASGSF